MPSSLYPLTSFRKLLRLRHPIYTSHNCSGTTPPPPQRHYACCFLHWQSCQHAQCCRPPQPLPPMGRPLLWQRVRGREAAAPRPRPLSAVPPATFTENASWDGRSPTTRGRTATPSARASRTLSSPLPSKTGQGPQTAGGGASRCSQRRAIRDTRRADRFCSCEGEEHGGTCSVRRVCVHLRV